MADMFSPFPFYLKGKKWMEKEIQRWFRNVIGTRARYKGFIVNVVGIKVESCTKLFRGRYEEKYPIVAFCVGPKVTFL